MDMLLAQQKLPQCQQATLVGLLLFQVKGIQSIDHRENLSQLTVTVMQCSYPLPGFIRAIGCAGMVIKKVIHRMEWLKTTKPFSATCLESASRFSVYLNNFWANS